MKDLIANQELLRLNFSEIQRLYEEGKIEFHQYEHCQIHYPISKRIEQQISPICSSLYSNIIDNLIKN